MLSEGATTKERCSLELLPERCVLIEGVAMETGAFLKAFLKLGEATV